MPEAIPILMVIFGMPVAITYIVASFRYRTKELALKEKELEKRRLLNPAPSEELDKKRKELESRIENLESIVCSVDFELNARLNRLAAAQSRQLAAHNPGDSSPPPGGTMAEQAEVEKPLHILKPGQVVLGRNLLLGRGHRRRADRPDDAG